MAGGLPNKEMFQSLFENRIGNNFCNRDINENIFGEMRGINNKGSPDSGWMFPGLINPGLFPAFFNNTLPAQSSVFNMPNKQFMEKSPIDIRSHELNHSSQFSQHNILNNPDGQIQNKLKSYELNARKYQQGFEKRQENGINGFSYKCPDNVSGFQNGFQMYSEPAGIINHNNHLKSAFNYNSIHSPSNIQERRMSSSNDNLKQDIPVTAGTPATESHGIPESYMQQQHQKQFHYNMRNPMLGDSQQMQVAFATAAAQMSYLSLLKNGEKFSIKNSQLQSQTNMDVLRKYPEMYNYAFNPLISPIEQNNNHQNPDISNLKTLTSNVVVKDALKSDKSPSSVDFNMVKVSKSSSSMLKVSTSMGTIILYI